MDDNITFSDYLINKIQSENVNDIFSLTGGGIMHIVDSIYRSKIDLISVHHEMFAGVAADSYARISKNLGVAIGTTGPGLANLFTSVAASYQDSSPVLFIGGQVKKDDSSELNSLKLRQNGTFEFNSLDAFKPITKYCSIVHSFEDGIKKIEEAIYFAREGRPGPVLLEIPLDVQAEKMSKHRIKKILISNTAFEKKPKLSIKKEVSNDLEKALNFQKPLVVLGNGINRISNIDNLKRLIVKNNIPFVTSCFAKDLESISPKNFLGVMGLRGNRSANIASQEADSLIIIGSSLHQQVIGWESKKFNPQAHKLWVEIDKENILAKKKILDISKILNCSLESFIGNIPDLNLRINKKWLEYCKYLDQNFREHIETNKEKNSYYDFVSSINNHRNNFHTVVCDAGLAWYIVPQVISFDGNRRLITSGSFGSMGMALSYGVGAALANRHSSKKIAIIIGDGSLMSCIQELSTLRENDIKATIFILNNNGYCSIRTTHEKFFSGRKIGTDATNGVHFPSFKKISEAFGINYKHFSSSVELEKYMVSSPDELEILELDCNNEQVVVPMVASILNSEGKFETPKISEMTPLIKYKTYEHF